MSEADQLHADGVQLLQRYELQHRRLAAREEKVRKLPGIGAIGAALSQLLREWGADKVETEILNAMYAVDRGDFAGARKQLHDVKTFMKWI